MSGGAAGGLGPFDPYWTDATGPPRRDRVWPRRLALAIAAALAMVGVAALSPSRPSINDNGQTVVAGSPGPAEPPALSAPALALDGVEANAVTHELNFVGGGRSDALSVGRLDGDGPAVRVELARDDGRRAAVSLFVAAAETAAAGGAAVERVGPSQSLASAMGRVEWAKTTLAGGAERGCAAFRYAPRGGGLRGVVCAAPGATIEAAGLACLIERLNLTKAGREAGFGDVIKPPPPRRAACRTPLG